MSAAPSRKKSPKAATEPVQVDAASAGWQTRVVNRSLDRAVKRSVERGQSFIGAAARLMEETGSDSFTVQQVADEAGVSLRTLYQHFTSKDDLLLAVWEEQAAQHVAYVRAEVEKYSDPLERLAALIMSGSRGSDTPVSRRTVALTQYRMRLVVTHPEDVVVVQAPFVKLAQEVIDAAAQAGCINIRSVDHATYIISTLKSAYLHSHVLGNELGVEMPTVIELTEFCLAGLGAELPKRFLLESSSRATA